MLVNARVEDADIARAPVGIAIQTVRVIQALNAGVTGLVTEIRAAGPAWALLRRRAIGSFVRATDANAAIRRNHGGIAGLAGIGASDTQARGGATRAASQASHAARVI